MVFLGFSQYATKSIHGGLRFSKQQIKIPENSKKIWNKEPNITLVELKHSQFMRKGGTDNM